MKPWRERVAEAQERGSFTRQDMDDALDWDRCAVGEQHAMFPDVVVYQGFLPYPIFEPLDPVLRELGGGIEGFPGVVIDRQFEEAHSILDKIEDRVLELKRELKRDRSV